jgi:hypothetical protein
MIKRIISLWVLIFSVAIYGLEEEVELELTVWSENGNILHCEPAVLYQGQSFVMSLGEGHGKELAIRRHFDDRWYFLVVDSAPETMKEFMSPSDFEKRTKVTISDETLGFPWESESKNEVIFEQPGKYTVYVSDNLESDLGGYTCEIDYKISEG